MATNLFALGLLLSIFAVMLPTSIEKSIRPTTKTTMSSSSPGICQLPPKSGVCMANFLRWYYNHKTKTCQQFSYGGCGGNQNNFFTKTACLLVCGSGSHQGLKPVVTATPTTIEARKRVGNATIQHHPPKQKPKTGTSLSNKPCEVEKIKALASKISGVFVPECNHKGFYKAKQCWKAPGLDERCWCVNHQGNKVGEVRTKPNGQETCKPLKKTKGGLCSQIINIYNETLTPKVRSQLYIPQCDAAGHFIALQCDKKNCWCVDIIIGDKINNTSGTKGSVKCTST